MKRKRSVLDLEAKNIELSEQKAQPEVQPEAQPDAAPEQDVMKLPAEKLFNDVALELSAFLRFSEVDKNPLTSLSDTRRQQLARYKNFFSQPRYQVSPLLSQNPRLLFHLDPSLEGKEKQIGQPSGQPRGQLNKRYFTCEDQGPEFVELKQRGAKWDASRNNVITGSRIEKILGFWGFESLLQTWYDTYMQKKYPPGRFVEECIAQDIGKERMSWGTNHEIDAVATFMQRFAQTYDLEAYECVQTPIDWPDSLWELIQHLAVHKFQRVWTKEEEAIWRSFMKDSPDLRGIFKRLAQKWVAEIKAKYGDRSPDVYSKIPYYYIPQALAHALAVQTDGTFFMSWCPTHARVWFLNQSLDFWNMAMEISCGFIFVA